jgi:hypothetical protein
MAKNSFGSAPSGTGGVRGISRQIAAVLYLGNKNKSSKGLTFDEHSALEGQKHIQGIQSDVVKSVLTGQAAAQAHRNTRSQNKQKHGQALEQISATGEQDRTTATHFIDHFERLGSSGQFDSLNVGKSGTSGSFKKPDKSGVNLDS